MTHEKVEGVPIGQHPLVTRLMKGVYNLRPPKPRYTYTWDVDMVTQYIAEMGENANLTLKKLSQKLALLMALVVASWTSELQALDLRFRVYRPNGVLFHVRLIVRCCRPLSKDSEASDNVDDARNLPELFIAIQTSKYVVAKAGEGSLCVHRHTHTV